MGYSGRPAPGVLHPSLRASLGPAAVLGALAAVALGVLFAGDDGPGAVDERIRPAAGGAGAPGHDVALAVDFWGEPAGAAALVAALVTGLLLLRRTRAAVLTVAGAGAAVAATTLLKPVVGRTINDGYLSYPSGHTAFVTALALVAALAAVGRCGPDGAAGTLLVLAAALVAGAAMGWAQVALGAHYATDAVGGWCTALAVVPAAAWLTDRIADGIAGRRTGRGTDAGRRKRR